MEGLKKCIQCYNETKLFYFKAWFGLRGEKKQRI